MLDEIRNLTFRKNAEVDATTSREAGANTGNEFYNRNGLLGDVNQNAQLARYRLETDLAQTQATSNPYSDRTADQIVQEQISAYNGASDKKEAAEETGRLIADIARYDPAKASEVANGFLDSDSVRDEDKDELSQEAVRALSDSDLTRLVQTTEGRNLLGEMKTHLLGGSVHEDEYIDAARVDFAVNASGGGTAPPLTFTTAEGVPAADAYFTTPGTEVPQLAAERVKNGEESLYEVVERHQGDARWLQQFYNTMGTTATAEIIQNAALPPTTEYQTGIIVGSLQTLVEANLLNQSDMNALLGSAATSDGNSFYAGTMAFLTEAISSLDNTNPAALRLKNLYAESLANLSTGKSALTLTGDELERAREFTAAMATRTLASTPAENQIAQLNRWRYSLDTASNPNGFDDLINYAMQFPNEEFFPSQGMIENYSQVSTLLETVSNSTSSQSGLRADLFSAATRALNDSSIFENYSENTQFKDALSTIFTRDFDVLLRRGLLEDGRYQPTNEDLSLDFQNQISKFYELTLFTPPLGENADELIGFVNSKYTQIANDIANMSDAEFRNAYGRGRTEMSHAYGQLTGLFFRGLENGLNGVRGDAEKEAEIWETLFTVGGDTIGAVGGASGNPVAGVIATAVGSYISTFGDDVAQMVADGKYDDALETMRDRGINPHELIVELFHSVYNNTLPDPTERNGTGVKEAWERGYSIIEGAPEVPFD